MIEGRFVVPSFSVFPPGLRVLATANVLFTPGGFGIGLDGSIQWSEVFNNFDALYSISLSNGNLKGSLPNEIPWRFNLFYIGIGNQLSGSIPDSLFRFYADNIFTPGAKSLTFGVVANNITGTIPSNLFSPLQGIVFNRFHIELSSNKLESYIPESLFEHVVTTDFRFIANANRLSGPLPSTLFPSKFQNATRVFCDLNMNQLSGLIPVDWLAHVGRAAVSLDLSWNNLAGTLPAKLFFNDWSPPNNTNFKLNLASNQLIGSIPSTFLSSSSFVQNATLLNFELNLSNNSLSGSIPPHLLRNDSATGITISNTFQLTLGYNSLNGSIPETLFRNLLQANTFSLRPSVTLQLEHNQLSGSISPSLVQDLHNGTGKLQLQAFNNLLSGSVPAFCFTFPVTANLLLGNNNLSGELPAVWSGLCSTLSLDITNNTGVTGRIPPHLLASSAWNIFSVSRTSLFGPIYNVSGAITRLDLSYTQLQLCNTSSFTVIPSSCDLSCTDASDCATLFGSCKTLSCPPGYSLEPPSSANPSSFCPPLAQPSSDFVCHNGVWIAYNVTIPTFYLPAGAGTVIVRNISSSVIVFQGIDTSLSIDGCATNLSSIVVQLTPQDIEKLEKSPRKMLHPLISLSGSSNTTSSSNCSDNLNDIALTTQKVGGGNNGCKDIRVEKVLSDEGRTFGAYFTVDSGRCNRWWIILVSVVAVVIVCTAVAVVGYVVWNKKRFAQSKKSLSTNSSKSEVKG